MAVSYPLTVPTGLNIRNSSFRLMNAVGVSESPFTYTQQAVKHQGAKWEGEVTLVAKNHTQIGEIQAFLTSLRGQLGTFLYGDPDFLAKGVRGSNGGTPLVDGASQTGNTLDVKGFPLSTNGIWLKGDYVQLDTGADSELYMVVEDVDSDGAGLATVSIEPALKSSPADSEAIETTGAKGVFRLIDNAVEWQANHSSIYETTIAFREAITE